jgi:Flp pilus assembly pilin Flp
LQKSERSSRNWRLASLIEGGILAALIAVMIIR